jgi:hypothetical protein
VDSEPVHAHAQSRDTHETTTAHQGANVNRNSITLPSRDAVALTCAIVALAIAVILVLGMFGLYNRYFVLKMNYDDLKAAMILHGVDPHPHLPTEER